MRADDARATKRLFVGTFISASDQEKLARLSREHGLDDVFHTKLRWVGPEKLHLTWMFFGQTGQRGQAEILHRLERVCASQSRFSISYSKAILFPSARKPRMIVLSPQGTSDNAQRLSDELQKTLASFCERVPERTYRPHITMVRFPKDLRGRLELPENWPPAGFLPIEHRIDSIALIESHLGAKNQYEIVGDFPLG